MNILLISFGRVLLTKNDFLFSRRLMILRLRNTKKLVKKAIHSSNHFKIGMDSWFNKVFRDDCLLMLEIIFPPETNRPSGWIYIIFNFFVFSWRLMCVRHNSFHKYHKKVNKTFWNRRWCRVRFWFWRIITITKDLFFRFYDT